MRIRVRAQPRSSQQKIIKNEDGSLKVYLKSSPVAGRANKELCKLIAEFYKVNPAFLKNSKNSIKKGGVKKSAVKIITGYTSRNKIIEISFKGE